MQALTQGNRSVEDYFKDMEMVLMRVNIVEDSTTTMARFIDGLNKEIMDVLELHHFVDMEDLAKQAIKAKK